MNWDFLMTTRHPSPLSMPSMLSFCAVGFPRTVAACLLTPLLFAALPGCTTKHHRESLEFSHRAEPLPFYGRTLEWMENAPQEGPAPEAPIRIAADIPSSPDYPLEVAARVLDMDTAQLATHVAQDRLEAGLPGTFSLEELLAGVALHNPDAQAAHAQWQAVLHQYSQADYLEELLRGYLSFTRYLETGAGQPLAPEMLQNYFPYPSTLTMKGEMIREMTRMAELEWERTLREVLLDAGMRYFEYQFQHRAAATATENVALLDNLINVVQDRYATGLASQADVLRMQTELERQRNLQLEFQSLQRISAAAINSLLGRPAEARLGRPGGQSLRITLPAYAELAASALEQRQEVLLQHAQITLTQLALRMGEIMNRPLATQGYSLFDRGMMAGQTEDGTGMPFGSVAMSAPMPAAYAQTEAYLGEMRQRLNAQQHQLEAIKVETGLLAQQALQEAEIAQRAVELVEDVVLPLETAAHEIALRSYTAGEMSFLDLLDAERKLIQSRLELDSNRMRLNQALLGIAAVRGRLTH